MHPLLKKFGSRVRHLRQARGLSQEELADRCRLHRTYIGSVERGERNLGLLNTYAIAKALGASVVDLFAEPRPKAVRIPTPPRDQE